MVDGEICERGCKREDTMKELFGDFICSKVKRG